MFQRKVPRRHVFTIIIVDGISSLSAIVAVCARQQRVQFLLFFILRLRFEKKVFAKKNVKLSRIITYKKKEFFFNQLPAVEPTLRTRR